jgi:hypothetical protein
MGAPRRLAVKLLQAMARLAPSASRDWAAAMLRELDFIAGDWAALFWALGSATAICRHAASGWRAWFKSRTTNKEGHMNSLGKKAVGVGFGTLCALMLCGCAFAVLRIMDLMFPSLGLAHSQWTHWLAVIVIPEAIFVTAAVILWRKKGPVAAGILTIALVIALHVGVHIAMRH